MLELTVSDILPGEATARRVIDVFIFFNELDLLELRFRTMYDVVDYFVITECTETFSGKPKAMTFAENRARFQYFEAKIIYNPISTQDLERLSGSDWDSFRTDLNRSLPYKHGGRPARGLHPSVLREIRQRDAGILALSKVARPHDLILLSDIDEIPRPSALRAVAISGVSQPSYFQMDWFLYWINNRVEAPWLGTVAFSYEMLKGLSLDMMRYGSSDLTNVPGPVIQNGGWHFSYLGGNEAIATKLKALAYQGVRAEVAMFVSRFRRKKWQKVLDDNSDLLMQNRTLHFVPLDDSFPAEIYQMPDFIKTYSKAGVGPF
jgi:beta-1,4-mannosyl-glycoprotein beta-1,4-N-acetylglucosaminyltransferase